MSNKVRVGFWLQTATQAGPYVAMSSPPLWWVIMRPWPVSCITLESYHGRRGLAASRYGGDLAPFASWQFRSRAVAAPRAMGRPTSVGAAASTLIKDTAVWVAAAASATFSFVHCGACSGPAWVAT